MSFRGIEYTVMVATEVLREGDRWLARCPRLLVSSHGRSESEAREMLTEALTGYLEDCREHGVLEEALRSGDVIGIVPTLSVGTSADTAEHETPGWVTTVPVWALDRRIENASQAPDR